MRVTASGDQEGTTMARDDIPHKDLDRARAERDAAERDERLADDMGHDAHARKIWHDMEEARDRAEEMGDRVEPGTLETGTGSRSSEE
jgi:hypothetical protein